MASLLLGPDVPEAFELIDRGIAAAIATAE